MCGFAGFLDPERRLDKTSSEWRLRIMAKALRHRGPDSEGVFAETESTGGVWAGLAHRRLSIIDLSPAGEQPMNSRSGRYVVAYNGEIYNFQELRAELEAEAPCNWCGHSDTEVLLEIIDRHGLAVALDRLDGMFAIALIDRETRQIILARDAFGEKPLAYGICNGVLLFGSELGALTTWPGFFPKEDAVARVELLQYSCIPAPRTIYAEINKLLPAHMIAISLEDVASGALPSPQCWWNARAAALAARQNPLTGGMAQAVEMVEACFAHSVAQRMISDVPLGALLSGGVDSSLTTALMQRASSDPVHTFAIGMAVDGFDESPHAKAVAQHLGTRHETLMLTPEEALAEVPKIAGKFDEPFADSSQLPTYLVSKMARAHVTVALSGDGGDELFAGYNRHFLGAGLWSKLEWLPVGLRHALGLGLGILPPGFIDKLVCMTGPLAPRELAAGRAGEKLQKFARIVGSRDRVDFHARLLQTGDAAAVLSPDALPLDMPEPLNAGLDTLPFGEAAMLQDVSMFLHDDIMTKVDRASMAASLEIRTPFLNRQLFELAWRLPMDIKTGGGQGKRVLREILHRHVPVEMVDRPKAGFAMPIGRWLRGPLVDWAESLIGPDALACTGVFDQHRVRRIWDAHRTGRRDYETQLWPVLMYQAWRLGAQDLKLSE